MKLGGLQLKRKVLYLYCKQQKENIMRLTFEVVHMLIEKTLSTGSIRVVGVYDSIELAEEVMEEMMTIFKKERAYKIDSRTLVSK